MKKSTCDVIKMRDYPYLFLGVFSLYSSLIFITSAFFERLSPLTRLCIIFARLLKRSSSYSIISKLFFLSEVKDLANGWFSFTVKLFIGPEMFFDYFSALQYPFEYKAPGCYRRSHYYFFR